MSEASTSLPAAELARALELHPQVAVRPEPFGALAYHYGNRRLVFLRHPDVVKVVEALADHADLAATLRACGVAEARWPGFVKALAQLERSEIIRAR
ncbi:MAG: mycofactocin biosynthesis chaperone MftB [Acidimicrobiales bacterium]|nr:mycofactocin biosynthesis chaperone MftB [Acidimicrobiales bacterium]